MYRLAVRDHAMIAHSFKGAVFGPAQRLHGATYVVDAEFARSALDEDGLVIDIGLATELLRRVLEPLNHRNLDDLAEFEGANTTTEYLAHHIFVQLQAALRETDLRLGDGGLESLKITLHESHVAWAAYEAPLAASGA